MVAGGVEVVVVVCVAGSGDAHESTGWDCSVEVDCGAVEGVGQGVVDG